MSNSNDYRFMTIEKEAEKVREKIKGGTLYGLPVDMENLDMVILAAYWVGTTEVINERSRRMVGGGANV